MIVPRTEALPARIANHLFGHCQWDEYLRPLQDCYSGEARRCDADDRHRSAVDNERSVDDASVCAEAGAPEFVAQDDHWMTTRHAIVLRPEQATECRRDAERGEVVAGDEQPAGFGALALTRDVRSETRLRRQLKPVIGESLEIPEQRVAEDRVNTAGEIVGRSRAGVWPRRGDQHDLVGR